MCVFRNEYSEGGRREGESEELRLRDKEQAELGSPARLWPPCLFPSLSPVPGPAARLLPPSWPGPSLCIWAESVRFEGRVLAAQQR